MDCFFGIMVAIFIVLSIVAFIKIDFIKTDLIKILKVFMLTRKDRLWFMSYILIFVIFYFYGKIPTQEQFGIQDGILGRVIYVLAYMLACFIVTYPMLIVVKIIKGICGYQYTSDEVFDNIIHITLLSSISIGIFLYFFDCKLFGFEYLNWSKVIWIISVERICNFIIITSCMNKYIHDNMNNSNGKNRNRVILILVWFFMIWISSITTIYFLQLSSGYQSFANMKDIYDVIYYTVMTFTTVGYGDIAPLSSIAKITVVAYSLLNFYLVIIGISFIMGNDDNAKTS